MSHTWPGATAPEPGATQASPGTRGTTITDQPTCTCNERQGQRQPDPWCPVAAHTTEQPRIPTPGDTFTTTHDTDDN